MFRNTEMAQLVLILLEECKVLSLTSSIPVPSKLTSINSTSGVTMMIAFVTIITTSIVISTNVNITIAVCVEITNTIYMTTYF